jgi:hypothetical protein
MQRYDSNLGIEHKTPTSYHHPTTLVTKKLGIILFIPSS